MHMQAIVSLLLVKEFLLSYFNVAIIYLRAWFYLFAGFDLWVSPTSPGIARRASKNEAKPPVNETYFQELTDY